jgi:hypothetical protein
VPNDERADQSGEAVDPQISKLAEISREMVRLYRVQFGRGPTRARSDFAGRVLDRKVRAFISAMDTGKDVAVELFYLED